MTFTIAIPVFNGEKYLRQTLLSAVVQTRPADEILVVDDASTDGSADIVTEMSKHAAIRYLRNDTPTGFVDAWNRVIQHSKSEYVSVLHQDDLLDEQYLMRAEEAFRRFPHAQHLYCGYHYIDADGKRIQSSALPHDAAPVLIPGKEYATRYLRGVVKNRHLHRCPGVTTARSLLVGTCSYRKEAGLIADDDFFIRAGTCTDVIGIGLPLASFRIHDSSATGRLDSIARQLARDYTFEVQYHLHNREYLDDDGRMMLEQLASRFIWTLLYEGITAGNTDWRNDARTYGTLLDGVVSGWRDRHLSVPKRLLWFFDSGGGIRHQCAEPYGKLIRAVMQLKKKFVHKKSTAV